MTESSSPKIAGLLLAAGGSSRLGRPKQLIEFEGKTLIRRAAEALIKGGCAPVVVVLGAEITDSKSALDGLDVAIAINEGWESGMGSSIGAGMSHLLGTENALDAVLISLCDQPHITGEHIKEFVGLFSARKASVVSAGYDGIAGVPALFSKALFPRLLSLTGDKGARELIRNAPDAVTIPLPEASIDIDTATDALALTER